MNALAFTSAARGLVVECGCYKGLSTYVLCRSLQMADPTFDGQGVHVFDSFEGLSEPVAEDRIDDPTIPVLGVPRGPGLFRSTLEETRKTLSDFPAITFHKGRIPGSFRAGGHVPARPRRRRPARSHEGLAGVLLSPARSRWRDGL